MARSFSGTSDHIDLPAFTQNAQVNQASSTYADDRVRPTKALAEAEARLT